MTVTVTRDDMVGCGILPGDVVKLRCEDKPSDHDLIVIKTGPKFKPALRYLRIDSPQRWRLLSAPEAGFREHICRSDKVKVIGVIEEIRRNDQPVELPLLVRMARMLGGT